MKRRILNPVLPLSVYHRRPILTNKHFFASHQSSRIACLPVNMRGQCGALHTVVQWCCLNEWCALLQGGPRASPHGHKSYSTSRQHILSFLLNSLLRNLICSHGFQRVNFQTYISNSILAAEIQTHLPTAYLISPLQNLRGVSNFIKVHLDSPKGRKCASLLKPTWSQNPFLFMGHL